MSDGNTVPGMHPSASLQTIFFLAFCAVWSYQPWTLADDGNLVLPSVHAGVSTSAESTLQLLFLSWLKMGRKSLNGELKGLIQFKRLVLAWQVRNVQVVQSQCLLTDLAQAAACQVLTAYAVCSFIWYSITLSHLFSVGIARQCEALGSVPFFSDKFFTRSWEGGWVPEATCACSISAD